MSVVNTGVDDGHLRTLATDASTVKLVHAGPLVHRVVESIGLDVDLGGGLHGLRKRHGLHGPDVGNAFHHAESVGIVDARLNRDTVKDVTAVKGPVRGAILVGSSGKLAGDASNSPALDPSERISHQVEW